MSRTLVIKIAVAAGETERLQTALTVAATAAASAVPVSVWLAGDMAWLGVSAEQSSVTIDGETQELLEATLHAASVAVCARCAARRGIGPEQLRERVTIKGAAAFVSEITASDAQALVY